MAAVSDSSPLILFDSIGWLDLLRDVFTELVIPPAVRHEVVSAGAGRPGAAAVQSALWIQMCAVGRVRSDLRSLDDLGPGEREAIVLALELGPGTALLLDDLGGRRAAQRLGLHVIGSGGVLALAKDRRLIPSVAPLLHDLRRAGLYLSDSAFAGILATAGETGPQHR